MTAKHVISLSGTGKSKLISSLTSNYLTFPRFCADMDILLPESEHLFRRAPTLDVIEFFFQLRIQKNYGNIEEKISIFTLLKEWNQIKQAVKQMSRPMDSYNRKESDYMKTVSIRAKFERK